MKKKSHKLSSFNLSFLDIMFCGFGAVVLLVLIINSNAISDNKIKYKDLTAEIERLKNEINAVDLYTENLQKKRQKINSYAEKKQSDLKEMNATISKLERKQKLDKEQTLAIKKHIKALTKDILQIDENTIKQTKKVLTVPNDSGNKIHEYKGEGHRQYLTGLKLGGNRVLILIDSSASMLDETIVNIIVKRNLSVEEKKASKKWQQAVNSVRWLVANLPASSQLLIVNFNKKAQSLSHNQSLHWINNTNSVGTKHLFKKLFKLVPQEGTNLINAFSIIRKLSRKPDNVILITDGLPTQGNNKTNRAKVSPSERIKLFNEAIKILPEKIPINTILLPMEGDPMAASLFWKLAIDTRGSFMTPSSDWP